MISLAQSNMNSNDCRVCNQPFKSPGALQQHERDSSKHAANVKHLQKGSAAHQRPFPCETCNRHFGSVGALQQHQNDSHNRATEIELEPQVPADDSPWSTFPNLHDDVLERLQEDGLTLDFFEENEDEDPTRNYDTNIMGAFICPNSSCLTDKWTSKRVAISIQLFEQQQYNAIVWHQRCQACNSLGELKVDEVTYVDRVVYRLKKWLGVAVVAPVYRRSELRRPHRSELCEGCKHGRCANED